MTEHLFTRSPWQHQREGVDQTIATLERGVKSVCLTAPTGAGKTDMSIALTKWGVEDKGGRVLNLTNRILLTEQTLRVFKRANVPVGVISSSMKSLEREEAPVQIATIQTILARRRSQSDYWVDADMVLADECFPAGTLIDGSPIETVQVGDSVRSYNHQSERIEWRQVVRTFKRHLKSPMVHISLSNGTNLHCTSTHPVYRVDHGEYVPADSLNTGDRVYGDSQVCLHGVQGGVCCEAEAPRRIPGVLFETLCRACEHSPQEKKGGGVSLLGMRENVSERQIQDQTHEAGVFATLQGAGPNTRGDSEECQALIGAYVSQEPDAQGGNTRESVAGTQTERPQTYGFRGKRSGNDEAGTPHCRTSELASYCRQNVSPPDGAEDARPLQDRCRQSRPEDCHRDRRGFTQQPQAKGTRPKEGSFPSVARVVSVEVYEPQGGRTTRGMSHDYLVYNLEVEGNNNYFANGLLVHNCHQMAGGESAALLNEYKDRGSQVVGTTATPLGVCDVCDELIVAARTRDLQDQGILCYAQWFAPCELDTRKLTKGKVDLSLSENEARRTWGPLTGNNKVRTRIVGNILEHYKRLHPDLSHTLAFAPGVKESLWAAQFCHSQGIRALHVDGQDFWFDGTMYDRKKHTQQFKAAMQEWREGAIPILWNRFVLREGIDEPNIRCIMLATPVGSYRSFLQMVGRGLRTHESKNGQCTVLDFGGSWWRHGSVNVNVDWESVFDCSDPEVISKNRIAEQREKGESMGRACPKCGMVHKAFSRLIVCQYCGHQLTLGKASRAIIQTDGKLTQVTGEPVKQWNIKATPEAEGIWSRLYWNAMKKHNGDVTPNQLYANFAYVTAVQAGSVTRPAFNQAYHPPRDTPLMPTKRNDWHRPIALISDDNLY